MQSYCILPQHNSVLSYIEVFLMLCSELYVVAWYLLLVPSPEAKCLHILFKKLSRDHISQEQKGMPIDDHPFNNNLELKTRNWKNTIASDH